MQLQPVIYAEDDENDAFLMERAFRKAGLQNTLQIVADGKQAMDRLSRTERFSDTPEHPAPCMLLLDLKMPRKSGFEVLQWIRQQPALYTLPVIIFTSSNQERDVHNAYALGANAYLIKPASPDQLTQLVGALRDFWFGHCQFPPSCLSFAGEPTQHITAVRLRQMSEEARNS